MFPSVHSAFRNFNAAFEGVIPFMYLDIKGLVTIGVGNLIDPVELAQDLPFHLKGNPASPATKDQITAEWRMLKSNPKLACEGYQACGPLTRLELDDTSIAALISGRLARDEAILKLQLWFAGLETWPADAQLGLLSMAWAMGPGGPGEFPRFRAACRDLNFVTAAQQCAMDEDGNPGLIPRNRANTTLFSNAAAVLKNPARDRSILHFPKVLPLM